MTKNFELFSFDVQGRDTVVVEGYSWDAVPEKNKNFYRFFFGKFSSFVYGTQALVKNLFSAFVSTDFLSVNSTTWSSICVNGLPFHNLYNMVQHSFQDYVAFIRRCQASK